MHRKKLNQQMKNLTTLIIAFVITTVTFAQESTYNEDVKKCIKSNGTYAYYENMIGKMFTKLEKQYASHNVPDSVWSELKTLNESSLEELTQMIISAYREYFTHEDIKNMNALYASQAGQNMLKGDSALTESDKEVLTEFYSSETGQIITESQDFMNESMSEISEMWSSGFYKSLIQKLSAKGFNF